MQEARKTRRLVHHDVPVLPCVDGILIQNSLAPAYSMTLVGSAKLCLRPPRPPQRILSPTSRFGKPRHIETVLCAHEDRCQLTKAAAACCSGRPPLHRRAFQTAEARSASELTPEHSQAQTSFCKKSPFPRAPLHKWRPKPPDPRPEENDGNHQGFVAVLPSGLHFAGRTSASARPNELQTTSTRFSPPAGSSTRQTPSLKRVTRGARAATDAVRSKIVSARCRRSRWRSI
eukprot:scaffold3290_cov259-Pinguiococcus_pyrenoidosus.AAC.12